MKATRYTLLICVSSLMISCTNPLRLGDTPIVDMHFIPGECLNSYELSYTKKQQYQIEQNSYIFAVQLDLTDHVVDNRPYDSSFYGEATFDMPADSLFRQFGVNRKKVKQAYRESFDTMREYWITGVIHTWIGFDFTTVLYTGGLSLTADKPFAGHPAGEDLAPYLECHPSRRGVVFEVEDPIVAPKYCSKEIMGVPLDIPLDYVCLMGTKMDFCLPIGDCEVIKEYVTFHIEIPVRNVKYLTWLNDQISNPSAPVPYEDGVLTCTFTTQYGLK